MPPPDRLLAESAVWEREGLITTAQRRAILARYDVSAAASQQAPRILTWLAIILAAIGGIILIAWNWIDIPASAKIGLSAGPMIALYVAAAIFARTGRTTIAERLALAAALFAGGTLLVTDELLHINPQRASTLLLWTAVIAATAAWTPSALIAAAGAAIGTWALLVTTGGLTPPWWFLVVWAALALAVERVPNRWTAGAVTTAFGIWVFFLVLAEWNDQPTAPAIGVLLAANWLYTLAVMPASRRPAFARVTPALVVTLLGLLLLLPSGAHRAMTDWRVAADHVWPAVALFLALAGATFWNVHQAGTWRSRPAGLTVIAVLWLIAWFTLPTNLRASVALQWTWTAIFSGAIIHLGAASVREAGRTRDLGQLVVGVSSVFLFVIVRVVDARNLVVSGLLLLASAILLWWLARLWARPTTVKVSS